MAPRSTSFAQRRVANWSLTSLNRAYGIGPGSVLWGAAACSGVDAGASDTGAGVLTGVELESGAAVLGAADDAALTSSIDPLWPLTRATRENGWAQKKGAAARVESRHVEQSALLYALVGVSGPLGRGRSGATLETRANGYGLSALSILTGQCSPHLLHTIVPDGRSCFSGFEQVHIRNAIRSAPPTPATSDALVAGATSYARGKRAVRVVQGQVTANVVA